MERSGSVPSGILSMGSGPLPSLKEEDFEVGVEHCWDSGFTAFPAASDVQRRSHARPR